MERAEAGGPGALCRACLQRGSDAGEAAHIFRARGRDASPPLAHMLLACADIAVLEDDALPKTVCSSCVADLTIAYNFKLMCESSYRWLLENYQPVKEEDVESDQPVKEDVESDFKYLLRINNTEEPALSQNKLYDVENNNSNLKTETADVFKTVEDETDLFNFKNCDTPEYASCENRTKKKRKIRMRMNNNEKEKNKKTQLKRSQFPKTISCDQCPKKFAFPYMLRDHKQMHTSSKSYFCPICKKYYNSEKDHTKIHRNAYKFICDVCSKCFNTKGKIQIHLETHSTNRPKKFICDLAGCGKAYLSIQGLNHHKLVHSGVKNFLCHLCSKAFTDKSSLQLHMNIHFNERKFKCRTCEQSFFTPSNRHNHEKRRHSSERRFPCGKCEKRFISGTVLRRHMLTHTTDLPNECAFCPRRFSRKDNKSRHELVIHGFSAVKEKRVFELDSS